MKVTDFDRGAQVLVRNGQTNLSATLVSEVNRLWESERLRRGSALFDGRILSAIESDPRCIVARVVDYRLWVAQTARPALFEQLQIRPIAVSGILECADGIVLGRRSASVSQNPFCWEFCPSGGLSVAVVNADGHADYLRQIMDELEEELGLTPNDVLETREICLVEDCGSHVLDIGMGLLSPLSALDVMSRHRTGGSPEYEELVVLPEDKLRSFLVENHDSVAAASLAIFENEDGIFVRR